MSRPDEHVPFEELAVGHALSALEPEEERVFLEHLAGCARCELAVEEHRSTLAVLAFAAEPADPPPSVLQGIRAGMVAAPVASAPTPQPEDVPAAASLADARSRRTARTRASQRWTGVAAAAALVVGLGAWNLTLRSDRDALRERGDRLAAAVDQLGRSDGQRVPLAAEDGEVVAVALVHDQQVSLVANGLPRNDEGTSYVLWAQDAAGGLRPLESFDVTDAGIEVLGDLPVEGAEDVAAFALSREPSETLPTAPQGPVVASGAA